MHCCHNERDRDVAYHPRLISYLSLSSALLNLQIRTHQGFSQDRGTTAFYPILSLLDGIGKPWEDWDESQGVIPTPSGALSSYCFRISLIWLTEGPRIPDESQENLQSDVTPWVSHIPHANSNIDAGPVTHLPPPEGVGWIALSHCTKDTTSILPDNKSHSLCSYHIVRG